MTSYDLIMNVTDIAFDNVIHNRDSSLECEQYLRRMIDNHALVDHMMIADYGDDIHILLHRDHVTPDMVQHDEWDEANDEEMNEEDGIVIIVAYQIK